MRGKLRISEKKVSFIIRDSSTAFGIRNCPNKKQDVSTDQLCDDAPNRQTGETKKNAIDLKFFMEDNQDNEIYATLDDQVSLNSDTDNITTYRKNGFYNKSDVSLISCCFCRLNLVRLFLH